MTDPNERSGSGNEVIDTIDDMIEERLDLVDEMIEDTLDLVDSGIRSIMGID